MKQKLKDFFIKTAFNLADLSNCVSYKVGCLIVKDGRIISMGYNGTPKGYHTKCCDVHGEHFDREAHHKWSNVHEIHAEVNAIVFAANNGISIKGASLFTTLHPCDNCLKMLSQADIENIYYVQKYDKSTNDNDFLDFIKTKINIEKIELK